MATEIIARGILVREDYILLCQNKREGYWYLPGGHVEKEESAAEALAREIKEETGADAAVGAFAGAYENAFIQKKKKVFEINLFFSAKATLPEEPVSKESHIHFEWKHIDELPLITLKPNGLQKHLPAWIESKIPFFESS